MRTAELDYELPAELIARDPPRERDGGRLMVLDRARGEISHRFVRELPSLLARGSLVVFNDTRVIPARLHGTKPTGGRAEIFLLHPLDASEARWLALGRASKKLRVGTCIRVADDMSIEIASRRDDGTFEVRIVADDARAAIDAHGEVPLPPYLGRAPGPADATRYQTVFAEHRGAVAAPTAGLHFTDTLLASLDASGIERARLTLHVGAGTFSPVLVDDLDEHAMHAERYEIPDATAALLRRARDERRAVVAIGTTVVRALESWGGGRGPLRGETRLLLQPGAEFRVATELFTNFHLPRSTLLALVMAFAGVDFVRSAYALAIREGYRFYSYGDAMLIL